MFLLVLTILSAVTSAQNYTQFSHYTADEGLSENNVRCILQDRKGIMWFGTFDGLNKFDGYTFKTYKGNPGKHIILLNYRVDRIVEDACGYLWIQTYDGHTYRFDPSRERFLAVPHFLQDFKSYSLSLSGLYAFNDSSVWITGGKYGDGDCFRIKNTNDPDRVDVANFNTSNGQLTSDVIKTIFLDSGHNTWILTQNGINLLRKDTDKTIQYFKNGKNDSGGFLSILEIGTEIYIGGEKGRFLIYNRKKETFESVTTPFLSDIISIKRINQGNLFILTNKSGFAFFDLKTHQFKVFNKSNGSGLKSDNFFDCYLDNNHNVWLDTDNPNVVLFETQSEKVNNFSLFHEKSITYSSGLNFFVTEGNDNLWVHSRTGGFWRYNSASKTLDPFYNDLGAINRKFSNIVRTATSDRQGNLWMCPYNAGIIKGVFRKTPFRFYKPLDNVNYSEQNLVRSLYEDKDKVLWVGTKNGYLYLFDENRKLIGRVGADGRLNSREPFMAQVYNIMSDYEGNIWLATKGNGIFKVKKAKEGKSITLSFTNFRNNQNDLYSLSSDAVYNIFEDHSRRLWIATFGGGINLMENKNGKVQFINSLNKLKDYPKACNRTRFITQDRNGCILVGTTQGLVAFKYNNQSPEKTIFHHFVHEPDDVNSISGNDVHYILPAKNGNLYLGIYGGGLDVVANGISFGNKPVFKSFRRADGLPSDVVFTLQEDSNGEIWMSTQTKLVKFSPANSNIEVYNPVTSGSYSFTEATVYRTHEGNLIYGTTEGYVEFNPREMLKSQFVPPIMFTNLQILSKQVDVGVSGSPLPRILDDMDEIKLTHKQNIISISFAAMDYTDPQAIHYAYKLDGIDADWNYVGNQRVATYSNLPWGKHIFHVKSTNADGKWVNNERTIMVNKLPSFFESTLGLVFYVFLFISITALATYTLFSFYRLKNEVVVEHRISEMKLNFFTDISHELRTPLTLIASPVENILRKEAISDKIRDQLQLVWRNTERMLRLINQILDFHKIQSKRMKLEIEDVHVAQFMGEICSSFMKLAEERNVSFKISDNSNNSHLWVDRDKFEKIFFNLLSNALKFTPSGKSVEVILEDGPQNFTITVKDTGIGIGKDRLKQIFDRFESFASTGNIMQPGTGIGLALTRELVELHKATIRVESEPGKGAAFIVSFHKGYRHFDNDDDYVLQDIKTGDQVEASVVEDEQISEQGEELSLHSFHEVPSILIVEDNAELRNFLSSVLRNRYTVIEATNGKEALHILPDSSPDLVISDLMMPEMSGLELAKAVKSDINISHIPFVLLTAKTDIDSKVEAMEYGVDDYITKPFSSAYLEARIANLLKLRRQLQEYYRSSLTSGVISISKPNVTSQDDIFIQGIMKYIEDNIEKSDLSIDALALNMGLSRSSMFKKIKSLTGLAPVDFIKELRIQRAAQLFETGEFNVSQVTYMIGMTDPRYFSKCFRQKYGMTPSEYRDKCTL